MAALMAQESTFTAEIRSLANAYGLMQIIPGTGRTLRAQAGHPPFSTAMLRQPEANVRIGTQLFQGLIDRFGGAHFALAELQRRREPRRRWSTERPGAAAGRVHRQHPVRRDAELREADPRHGRGLPPPLRRRHHRSERGLAASGDHDRQFQAGRRGRGPAPKPRAAAPPRVTRQVPTDPPLKPFSLMDHLLDLTRQAEARHFWFRGFRHFVAPVLADVAAGRRDLRLLDCGCGTGQNLALLRPTGARSGSICAEGRRRGARGRTRPGPRGHDAIPFRSEVRRRDLVRRPAMRAGRHRRGAGNGASGQAPAARWC